MKKFSSMLLAFLLSVSLLISGCDGAVDSSSPSNSSASSEYSTTGILAESKPTAQSSASGNSETALPTTGVDSTITSGTEERLLKVYFIDVGQGDSIFIQLPDKRAMLIDAGEADFSQAVIKTIKEAREDTLDYVIATHPHSDHIGGMAEVIKSFKIGSIYMPKVSQTTKTFENLLTTIQSKGLKVNTAKAGVNILNAGDLKADILAPVRDDYKDLNDWSAVLKLTYGSTSFLFAGDATATSEKDITGNLKADVLKIGHHGSKTSTSDLMLSKVSPKYAVISVGKGNSYGHPAAETLDRLKNANVQVYRTDLSGTIVFSSDGKKITVNKSPNYGSPSTTKNTSAKGSTTNKATSTTKKVETTKPATTKPGSNDSQNVYVYITESGSKYHRDGCTYLSKSKIKISLKDAKGKYQPCSKCNPPQ